MLIFLIILIAYMLTIIHMGSIVLMSRAANIGIEKIALGMGPTLYTKGKLVIHWLPFGGYVKFPTKEPELFSEIISEEIPEGLTKDSLDKEYEYIDEVSVFKRIYLTGSALVCMLVGSDLLLEMNVYAEYVSVIGDYLRGAWSPLSDGQAIINSFMVLFSECSLPELVIHLVAYYAIFNLLPLPLLAGGDIIFSLIQLEKKSLITLEILNWIGLILVLLWMFALIRYFLFWWI